MPPEVSLPSVIPDPLFSVQPRITISRAVRAFCAASRPRPYFMQILSSLQETMQRSTRTCSQESISIPSVLGPAELLICTPSTVIWRE